MIYRNKFYVKFEIKFKISVRNLNFFNFSVIKWIFFGLKAKFLKNQAVANFKPQKLFLYYKLGTLRQTPRLSPREKKVKSTFWKCFLLLSQENFNQKSFFIRFVTSISELKSFFLILLLSTFFVFPTPLHSTPAALTRCFSLESRR